MTTAPAMSQRANFLNAVEATSSTTITMANSQPIDLLLFHAAEWRSLVVLLYARAVKGAIEIEPGHGLGSNFRFVRAIVRFGSF